jgi:5-methyltetrahydropteroyltriglutamate--homocysteine methyltransferase
MRLSTDRILTTHAGSLPRPDDLAQMLYDVLDEKPIDEEAFRARVREAVADIVARQREVGIDEISDGELGKVGFSNYVLQRMSGFAGHAQFMAADLADAPEIIPEAMGDAGAQHMRLPILDGPIEARDTEAIVREIDDLSAALGGKHDGAFVPAVTPGHVTFNFPNHHYATHQEYIEAAAAALAPE